MASENHGGVLRGIDRVFNQGSATGLAEGQLLRQFAAYGDEAAFEALLTRHGPMVLGVCRRLLFDPRDVEDAFQATFLVLLRRAGALRETEPLSPWLHGVAYRVAARIRARSARRPAGERQGARPEAVEPGCPLEGLELRRLIDEEIGRLPEKYRRPVVLCYLEGQTHEQAARRLDCTEGSVRGRLDRAREKLKAGLARRGLAPAAGLTASTLAADVASAAVPPPWIAGTVATLGRAATAQAVSTTVSAAARELADGVFRTMLLAKLKVAASFVTAAAVILAVGAVLMTNLTNSLARDGQVGKAATSVKGQRTVSSPETSAPGRDPDPVYFRVVDKKSGRPIAGATLVIRVNGTDTGRTTTDASGRAVIAVPKPMPNTLDVLVEKPDFAPMRSYLRFPRISEDIPASHTLAMDVVKAVGGVVRDEQGRPIEGVEVKPIIWTHSNLMPSRDEFIDPKPISTDARGVWRWESMPAGIEPNRVSFQFSHPDYQRVDLPSDRTAEIIRREVVTVLPRGLLISGRVVDVAGRSIPGARILRSWAHSGRDGTREVADAEGRFRFSHVPAGEAILTVQAQGHAPELKKIDMRPDLPNVEIRLEKGRTIRGRVVDRRGEPLVGASVNVEFWRKYQTLDWRTPTDGEGEFVWHDAPSDAVSIGASFEGYLRVLWREVPPGTEEISITLVKELKVRGTVVDAETRHAVQSFTLVPGMESPNGFSPYWERDRTRTLSRGRYEVRFQDASRKEGRRIRIEADGYKPEVSRVIQDDEDDPVVNFVLHKSAGISGVVYASGKSPLSGADVVLVMPSQPAFIKNGSPPDSIQHRISKTDAAGRFAFPAQEPPFTLLLLHDSGFAEQTFDADPDSTCDLAIKPWGRIDGTLRIGDRPGAAETIHLSYDRQGNTPSAIPWWSGEATTDATGRFALERVVPGVIHLSRIKSVQKSPSSVTNYPILSKQVDVAPGATTRVSLGGTGRPIVGKLNAPAEIAGRVNWNQSDNSLILKATPDNMFSSAMKKMMGTPAVRRSYSVLLDKDGSFRVEDVEAGTYDLILVINEPSRDPRGFISSRVPLASAQREVTVPGMPGGRSDKPLDLGAIPLVPLDKK